MVRRDGWLAARPAPLARLKGEQVQDHTGGAASAIVKADSVLAATAREILTAHGGPADSGAALPLCGRCGAVRPCPPVRVATQVLTAAGLPPPRPDTPAPSPDPPPRALDPPPPTPGSDARAAVAASSTAVLPRVSALPVARYLPTPPAGDTRRGAMGDVPAVAAAPAGPTR